MVAMAVMMDFLTRVTLTCWVNASMNMKTALKATLMSSTAIAILTWATALLALESASKRTLLKDLPLNAFREAVKTVTRS